MPANTSYEVACALPSRRALLKTVIEERYRCKVMSDEKRLPVGENHPEASLANVSALEKVFLSLSEYPTFEKN
jgi:hypothetical protein